MITPRAEISVNGIPVASIFNERLVSVTITDKEGVTSDSISCDLNDGSPFVSIPKKGDTITASIGYVETGSAFIGSYIVDDPEVRCLPYGITVKGKASNIRDQLKQHRPRHWDKKTVKHIVTEIASDNGLAALIDDDVGSYTYQWFGQQDESDLHVVERLARRHDALFSIKGGKLIFAAKGSGKSATGRALTPVVASPSNIVQGTCRTTFSNRNRFKRVKARVQNRAEAKIVEVEEESDAEGTADYTIPEPFADEGEARNAARSKARHLKSETIRTFVTLFGDPAIRAGAPFRYSGVRPELDGIEFIIETARHQISKSGYTTEIEAKLKVSGGGSGTSKASSSVSTGEADQGDTGNGSDDGATPPTGGDDGGQGGIGHQ
jgi:phage protein D